MQTKFDKVSSTLGNLKVEVSEADYKPSVEKKIREYAKTAQVKGFRPGHVPIPYIKNLYGKSILVDEVIRIASDAVNNVIKEEKLNIVGEPKPTEDSFQIDWHKQKDFTFEYTLGFASAFTVDVNSIPAITQYEIEPSEEQVQNSIEDLKKRFGVDKEPEVSAEGDIIFGKLSQESTEFFFQSGIPTDKVKADAKAQFIGLKKEDTIKFDIQSIFETARELGFATGKSDEEAEQLQGEFTFVVERISRVEPAELNQEFFDKVLGADKAKDEKEFVEQVRAIISENYNRESDFLFDFEVEKALLDSVPIELPEEFLKEYLLEVNQGKATAEDLEREFPAILRGIKLDFIRAEVAKDHEIKVEYNDVVEEVKSEIRGYFGGQAGFDGMEEFIDNMAKKQLDGTNKENTRKYFERAFGRKVLNFLKEKVQRNKESVSVEKFNELASASYKN
ncbi:trigger factor [Leadbetterella byssophila]|uniref:trigger factor n=1 Tax=Leadbetterella byssophila TaxID=316068 RepID=UPI0039A2548B